VSAKQQRLCEEFRNIADKTVAIASYNNPLCTGVTLVLFGNYLGFAELAESFLNLLREIEDQQIPLERVGTEEEWSSWLDAYHSLAMRLLLHVWQIASHIAKIKGEWQTQEDPSASKAGLFFAPPSVDSTSWRDVLQKLEETYIDPNIRTPTCIISTSIDSFFL
jgi:hypothetical protein